MYRVVGRQNIIHPAPAFAVVLPARDGLRAQEMLQHIVGAKYIDRASRLVVVDVSADVKRAV